MCHGVALGIYQFGQGKAAILCAACGLTKTGATIAVRFDYQAPLDTPLPPPVRAKAERRVLAPGFARAVLRTALHSDSLVNPYDNHQGNPRLKFWQKVLCQGCGITYHRGNSSKRCPQCGDPNRRNS